MPANFVNELQRQDTSVVSRKYVKEGRVTSGAEAPLLFNRLHGSSRPGRDKFRSHLLKTKVTYFRDDTLDAVIPKDTLQRAAQ